MPTWPAGIRERKPFVLSDMRLPVMPVKPLSPDSLSVRPRKLLKNGAGDRVRTGDVQLGKTLQHRATTTVHQHSPETRVHAQVDSPVVPKSTRRLLRIQF